MNDQKMQHYTRDKKQSEDENKGETILNQKRKTHSQNEILMITILR
jgi:hypothetical protein